MPAMNYNPPQLMQRVSKILDERFAIVGPTVDGLATLDQFHTGGLPATIRLAGKLPLTAASHVLDVGSGLGGPARYIAATYGCRVNGVDLSEPFVETATMLTERMGLSGRVVFTVGSALALPFEDDRFDTVMMQHVAMNIEDRPALYGEIHRVLTRGGRFMTYDVVSQGGAPAFPVPWAQESSMSFLYSEEQTRAALDAAGFVYENWEIDGASMATVLQPLPGASPPMLAQLLGRPDFPQAVSNFAAALRDGRIAILSAVVRKP